MAASPAAVSNQGVFVHSPVGGPFPATASAASAGTSCSVSTQIGLIDLRSKLHDHDGGDTESLDKVRWKVMDWILGTKPGQFTGLLGVAVCLLLFGSLIWMLVGGNSVYDTTWAGSFWFSWGMFFDPGTQMGLEATEPWKIKVMAMSFSVLGFTYNLLMLGLIVDVVRSALEYWRKKRSRVVVNGHTILLGWTEKTLFVMEELIKSAENRGIRTKIVVLAEQPEFDMWQEICRHFPGRDEQSMIQVRKGSPCECDDLARVSAVSAREIIILGGPGRPRIVDLTTVRTIVALAALPAQPKGCIIAEVRTAETTSAISAVLDTAEGIFARDAIKRVLCLTAVQPVIGDIFQQLMSWCEGVEIYCKPIKNFGLEAGATFGQAFRAVPNGICLGVKSQGQHAVMTPSDAYELVASDRLLVAADSELDITMAKKRSRIVQAFRAKRRSADNVMRSSASNLDRTAVQNSDWADVMQKKCVAIVGWPNDIDDLLVSMDEYVGPGTQVHILASHTVEERKRRLSQHRRLSHLRNITIVHTMGSMTNVHALADLPLDDACAILVLADDALDEDPMTSDSACLASVITLDALLKGNHPTVYVPNAADGRRPRLICEVLSPVIERALPSGHPLRSAATFFHSSALETGLFTIASAQTTVYNTLLMLLQPNHFGQLALCALEDYLKPEESGTGGVSFGTLSLRLRENDEILLGYCDLDGSAYMNPRDPSALLAAGDRLIVMSRRPPPAAMMSFPGTMRSAADSNRSLADEGPAVWEFPKGPSPASTPNQLQLGGASVQEGRMLFNRAGAAGSLPPVQPPMTPGTGSKLA